MHYDTPEDVLEEIQNDFLDKNKVYLILWKDQYIQNPDILTSIFEFMQENKEIMQVLFDPNGNSSFIDSMQELVKILSSLHGIPNIHPFGKNIWNSIMSLYLLDVCGKY